MNNFFNVFLLTLVVVIIAATGCSNNDSSKVNVISGNNDKTAPETQAIISYPSNPTSSTEAVFTFTVSEEGTTFECKLDDGDWEECISPKKYTNLSEGSHTFQLREKDVAGNVDETPVLYSWIIDITAPETQAIISCPSNPTSSTEAVFIFTVSEEDTTFECKLDDGDWEECISPKKYTGLSEGSHTFKLKEKDAAGNVDETPIIYIWLVSTGTSSIKTIISVNRANPTTFTTISFGFTANMPATGYKCKLDEGVWSSCNISISYAGLVTGRHTFSVKAIDNNSNEESPPVSYNWWIIEDRIYAGGSYFNGDNGDRTCVITSEGTLWCWGDNSNGEIGNGTVDTISSPVTIGSEKEWVMVSLGTIHTCGIKNDSTLWCWGDNTVGKLGDGTTDAKYVPKKIGTENNWIFIAAGYQHTCGVKGDGTLWCWGSNAGGTGLFIDVSEPNQIGSDNNWSKVFAGYKYSCGIKSDNSLYCWGNNDYGKLGDGTTQEQYAPTKIGNESNWKYVSLSTNHTCSVNNSGELFCWGNNSLSQLGLGSFGGSHYAPEQVGSETNWKTVSTGRYFSCGAKYNGKIYCWGNNEQGQLGSGGNGGVQTTPMFIPSSGDLWKTIDSGSNHTCGIKENGTYWCWGLNQFGQLGNGEIGNKKSPVKVNNVTTWLILSAGEKHNCVIRDDHTLWCWGLNNYGQIGNGTTIDYKEFVKVSGSYSDWITVSAGGGHTCGIRNNGELYCWGNGTAGQLGNMELWSKYTPDRVGEYSDWLTVSAGTEHTCGIRADSTLYCWGNNEYGQLGDNNSGQEEPYEYYLPYPVTMTTGWKSVSAGGAHTCGIKIDGTLYCWGYNLYSQLGFTGGNYTPFPQKVGSDNDWKSVSAGDTHTCAIKNNGSLYCWGDNLHGEIGVGTATEYGTPQQISGVWKQVSAAKGNEEAHTCAIKSDNKLYCWGNNDFGKLGDGTTEKRNTPVVVGNFTDWGIVSSGGHQTCGLYKDNSMWCWGSNFYGQIGDNTAWVDNPMQTQ